MYKYGGPGHKPFPPRKLNFEFRSVPFSFENYEKYISSSDIGLIPQTIPVRKSRILRFLIGKWTRKYNEKSWDYLIRFKETTNIGRVMVFAQYGIPVISDMTPSSCRYVDESLNGFIAHSEGGWYAAIKSMLGDSKLRHQLGQGNYYMYHKTFHPEVQNRNLIKYINERIIK